MTAWVPAPIRPLPDLLVSQIAAGEVVERPASVVKELVENALDAMASSIWVTLEEGGRQLICVRDDGVGIPRDELALALGRHCTSKLQSLEQLLDVRTLGFRGEALPSIASVARVRLASCVRGATDAYQVSLEGADGRPKPEPTAHPAGTTVEVRELFFNVPARRRFLKSPRTELEHIDGYLRRLALSRPRVGFHLSHAGRRVFSVAGLGVGESPEARLGALMGPGFVRAALPVVAQSGDLSLLGWVAQPELFASTHSALQIWVVNDRVVRDPALAHAVRVALDERIPAGRYPVYSLALTVDPGSVDVNVHPTKLEVRHRDPRRVHDFVLSSVREAMGVTSGVRAPSPTAARRERSQPTAMPQSSQDWRRLAEPAARFQAQPLTAGWMSPSGTAWLVEHSDGLWVLDLARHYAERMVAAYAEGVAESLPLLIPVDYPAPDLSPERAQTLRELPPPGLVLQLEADRLRLLEAPACLRGLDPMHLLRQLLEAVALPSPNDRGAWGKLLAAWLIQHWPPARLAELLRLEPPSDQPEPDRLYCGVQLWTRVPLGAPRATTEGA